MVGSTDPYPAQRLGSLWEFLPPARIASRHCRAKGRLEETKTKTKNKIKFKADLLREVDETQRWGRPLGGVEDQVSHVKGGAKTFNMGGGLILKKENRVKGMRE